MISALLFFLCPKQRDLTYICINNSHNLKPLLSCYRHELLPILSNGGVTYLSIFGLGPRHGVSGPLIRKIIEASNGIPQPPLLLYRSKFNHTYPMHNSHQHHHAHRLHQAPHLPRNCLSLGGQDADPALPLSVARRNRLRDSLLWLSRLSDINGYCHRAMRVTTLPSRHGDGGAGVSSSSRVRDA